MLQDQSHVLLLPELLMEQQKARFLVFALAFHRRRHPPAQLPLSSIELRLIDRVAPRPSVENRDAQVDVMDEQPLRLHTPLLEHEGVRRVLAAQTKKSPGVRRLRQGLAARGPAITTYPRRPHSKPVPASSSCPFHSQPPARCHAGVMLRGEQSTIL